jgi:hypothetical protein
MSDGGGINPSSDGSANSGSMDATGSMMVDLGAIMSSISDFTAAIAAATGAAIGAALTSGFGLISPAQAASGIVELKGPDGKTIGIVMGPVANALAAHATGMSGFGIGKDGTIVDKDGNLVGVMVGSGIVTSSTISLNYGVGEYMASVSGPITIDPPDTGTQTAGIVFPHVLYQATKLQFPNGSSMSFTQAVPRTLFWHGFSDGNACPLMNQANINAMFAGQPAYLLPDFIGAQNGIMSLRTGKPMVAASTNYYPCGYTGFASQLYLELSSPGWAWVVAAGQSPMALDPATGRTVIPAAIVPITVRDGSALVTANEPWGLQNPTAAQIALQSRATVYNAGSTGNSNGGPDGGPDGGPT